MFYLPRICEHCLNPSCVASCPSGAMYKRAEDGIVLVDQDQCRGWRMCVTGCPYKKVYFNHRTGKAEKCTFCYPRVEVGLPTVCSETCVGRLRYIGLFLYDADRVTAAASVADEHDLYEAQLDLLLDPHDPEVIAAARARGHRRGLARRRPPLAGLPARQGATGWRCRCTRSSAPCRWSGTSRRSRRWSTGSPRPATTARTPATSSAPSTRCASRSSTSPSCSPRATPSRCAGVLQKLAAMRSYMRDVTLDRPRDESIAAAVGMTGGEIVEMYRLLAHRQVRGALRHPHRLRGRGPPARGARLQPRRRRRARDGRQRPVRRGAPGAPMPVSVETFHALRDRQTSDAGRRPRRAAGARVNLLNWDGKGRPPGCSRPRATHRPEPERRPMTAPRVRDQRPWCCRRPRCCLQYPDDAVLRDCCRRAARPSTRCRPAAARERLTAFLDTAAATTARRAGAALRRGLRHRAAAAACT